MKQLALALFAFYWLLPAPTSEACSSEASTQEPSLKPFKHPGLLHNRDDLETLKLKVAGSSGVFKERWQTLTSSKLGSVLYQPNAYPKVIRGPYNRPDIGGSEFITDAGAAYSQALIWSLTGEVSNAEKAIEILNDWSSTLKTVSGHDAQLLIGMVGVRFCNAAELIRHSDAAWPLKDQQMFETMLRNVFYEGIKDFNPTANGNWDASMIQTMIAIGIYLDDRTIFDRGVEQYLRGNSNGAIRNYVNEFGECQESGRDQAHTQMGLGFLTCACEMAWKQGVDLYGANDHRLALGHEYTAKYNLGHEVRYTPYRSIDGRYFYKALSSEARGRFLPIYRRAVNHYQSRIGIEMPFSTRAAEKSRSRRRSTSQMPWADIVYGLSKSEKNEPPDSQ